MLLLTDRWNDALLLGEVVGAVEPCTVATLDRAPVRSSDHAIIICDVALDTAATVAATLAVLANHRCPPSIPLLHLARHLGPVALARSQEIGATAVLPPRTSHAQVLFTVKTLVASARAIGDRGQDVDPAVRANLRDAGEVFSELFTASRRGGPVAAEALERGGNAILAAVAGGRIGAWLDVVRSHDDVTYQHCLLVAGLAAAFAARLGVSLKGQRLISQAALIHDIGKASVPHAILNKAGQLSAEEMAVMRSHAAIGHEMLVRQGGFDPQLLDIVRHHHEYLDGTGYPDGLQGDQVSAMVRLVTICDIYAALVERRSYKSPSAPRVALGILAHMGGKLDGGLLKAFHGLVSAG